MRRVQDKQRAARQIQISTEFSLFGPQQISLRIKSVYRNVDSDIDSISLQAYFDEGSFCEALEEIEEETKERLNEFNDIVCGCKEDIRFKYQGKKGDRHFPINILRFMRSDNNIKILENVYITDIISKIEKIIPENLSFDLTRLSLVESDPFLFKWNKVRSFNLKNK